MIIIANSMYKIVLPSFNAAPNKVLTSPKELQIYFLSFSTKTYAVGTLKNGLNETVLLSTQNICLD